MKEELDYQALHYDAELKKWDDNSLNLIWDMCNVYDIHHRIIVCHPNLIFNEQLVSKSKKDFDEVDWLELKPLDKSPLLSDLEWNEIKWKTQMPTRRGRDKILAADWSRMNNIDKEQLGIDRSNSYFNDEVDGRETFKYIHRRFRQELFSTLKTNFIPANLKVNEPRHLVVLEEDKLGGRLVRGIFKATKSQLLVAINPLYNIFKPQRSVWDDRTKMFSDKEFISLTEFIAEKQELGIIK